MNTLLSNTTHPPGLISRGLDAWALLVRLYIAQVFFLSGLTKIRDSGSTVALFTDE